jgi:hypothetical protein
MNDKEKIKGAILNRSLDIDGVTLSKQNDDIAALKSRWEKLEKMVKMEMNTAVVWQQENADESKNECDDCTHGIDGEMCDVHLSNNWVYQGEIRVCKKILKELESGGELSDGHGKTECMLVAETAPKEMPKPDELT